MTTMTPGTGDLDAALRPPRDDLFRAVLAGVEMREDTEAGDGRTLFGHFARFNEWNRIDSFFEGTFLERFAPGAFKKTFRERQPKVLFNHGFDPSMGKQAIGEIEVLREEDQGPYYEVRLFDGLPDLLMEGLRSGAYGVSHRFRPVPTRTSVVKSPPRSEHNPDGIPEVTYREVMVRELGPVTFPADEEATTAVRSLTDSLIFSHLARDEGALRQLIEFRDRGLVLEAPSTDEDAPQGDQEGGPADEQARQQDAPPKGSAGSESHPDHGRRDIRPRDPHDLSWIHGKSQPTRRNPWSP